jgi:hypothetical protein
MNFSGVERSVYTYLSHLIIGGLKTGGFSRDGLSLKRNVIMGKVFQTIYFDSKK